MYICTPHDRYDNVTLIPLVLQLGLIRNPNWSTSGMRVTLSYLSTWVPKLCNDSSRPQALVGWDYTTSFL